MVAGAHLFPFERDLVEATPRFRAGFLVPAAVLLVFRFVVGFLAADAFFDAFFFGDADAGFAFRFAAALLFLAAPIAAPDSAPITVPTTWTT
jgi:hypothetical protein